MQKVDLLTKLIIRIKLGKYKIVQHEELKEYASNGFEREI